LSVGGTFPDADADRAAVEAEAEAEEARGQPDGVRVERGGRYLTCSSSWTAAHEEEEEEKEDEEEANRLSALMELANLYDLPRLVHLGCPED
jgi:hypothetical protein